MFSFLFPKPFEAEGRIRVLHDKPNQYTCYFTAHTRRCREQKTVHTESGDPVAQSHAGCRTWRFDREGYHSLDNYDFGTRSYFRGGAYSGVCFEKENPNGAGPAAQIEENRTHFFLSREYNRESRQRPTQNSSAMRVHVLFHLEAHKETQSACPVTRLFFETYADLFKTN